MMHFIQNFTALILPLVFAAGVELPETPAFAQTPSSAPQPSTAPQPSASSALSACAPDLKQFCSQVTPGQGRMAACLKAYDDKISPACRTQLITGLKEVAQARKACQADVEKLCQTIEPGGGRLLGCLKQHESELSPSCKSETALLSGKYRSPS